MQDSCGVTSFVFCSSGALAVVRLGALWVLSGLAQAELARLPVAVRTRSLTAELACPTLHSRYLVALRILKQSSVSHTFGRQVLPGAPSRLPSAAHHPLFIPNPLAHLPPNRSAQHPDPLDDDLPAKIQCKKALMQRISKLAPSQMHGGCLSALVDEDCPSRPFRLGAPSGSSESPALRALRAGPRTRPRQAIAARAERIKRLLGPNVHSAHISPKSSASLSFVSYHPSCSRFVFTFLFGHFLLLRLAWRSTFGSLSSARDLDLAPPPPASHRAPTSASSLPRSLSSHRSLSLGAGVSSPLLLSPHLPQDAFLSRPPGGRPAAR